MAYRKPSRSYSAGDICFCKRYVRNRRTTCIFPICIDNDAAPYRIGEPIRTSHSYSIDRATVVSLPSGNHGEIHRRRVETVENTNGAKTKMLRKSIAVPRRLRLTIRAPPASDVPEIHRSLINHVPNKGDARQHKLARYTIRLAPRRQFTTGFSNTRLVRKRQRVGTVARDVPTDYVRAAALSRMGGAPQSSITLPAV